MKVRVITLLAFLALQPNLSVQAVKLGKRGFFLLEHSYFRFLPADFVHQLHASQMGLASLDTVAPILAEVQLSVQEP